MADEFIGVDVYGIEELNRKLAAWPLAAQNAAVDATSEYLLEVVRTYPPYAHITYKAAYGGFKSDKQRKYVMARIREGTITPGVKNRSQRFRRGWKVIDKGTSSMIVNEVPYGRFLMGDAEQARMPKMIGWKKLGNIIKERMKEIERRARAAIKKVMRRL